MDGIIDLSHVMEFLACGSGVAGNNPSVWSGMAQEGQWLCVGKGELPTNLHYLVGESPEQCELTERGSGPGPEGQVSG